MNSIISTETWPTLFRINPQGVFHISIRWYISPLFKMEKCTHLEITQQFWRRTPSGHLVNVVSYGKFSNDMPTNTSQCCKDLGETTESVGSSIICIVCQLYALSSIFSWQNILFKTGTFFYPKIKRAPPISKKLNKSKYILYLRLLKVATLCLMTALHTLGILSNSFMR